MSNKTISVAASSTITLSVAAVFLIAGFLSGNKTTGTSLFSGSCAAHSEDEHKATESEHSEHEHDTEQLPLEELEHKECEHDMPAVKCDECRFEVGVVRIDRETIEPLIETGFVEEIDRVSRLNFTGRIQLNSTKTVEAAPTAGGRIERIEKFAGDTVQTGDILAVVHSTELGQAKADYLERSSALELARTGFEREKQLYEKKISSQADYQAAANELNAVQASLTALDKRLRLFGLDSEQIAAIKDEEPNGTFADLIVRATLSGTVISMDVSAGQITGSGESICTITDLSVLWVWCDVYEKDLAFLLEENARGAALGAEVKVKAFEQKSFTGHVDYIGNVMDEYSGTVKMRVLVENQSELLRANMFAEVEISIPQQGKTPALLKTAVMEDGGERFVFQQWKDDLWVRRDVTTGNEYGDYVEVLGGVQAGARVVTGGAFMLKSDVLREKMGAGCAD